MKRMGHPGPPLVRRVFEITPARARVLRCSLVAISALIGCSCRSTERELAERFLEASARGDHQTVAQLSMVALPADIRAWRVLAISEPTREPYRVPMLRQRVAEAEDKRDQQFKDFGDFRNRNYDELARIQRLLRQNPEARFSGRLLELQQEWEAFREERRTLVENLHQAQRDLEWEIRKVTKSLQRESTPEYLTGEAVHERARVRVTTSGGAERNFILVLTRYELKNQFGAAVPTRWIVSEILAEEA